MKNVVILGAGYSGVWTAEHLAKKLRDERDVKITVIDKKPYHLMKTEIHEVATGRAKAKNISFDLKKILGRYGITVVTDEATDVNLEKREVICKSGKYPYDYLVVSAGSKPTYFGIPGAAEYTMPFWTLDDALAIKEKLHKTFKVAGKSKKSISIYVIGAGLTGVEIAGELGEYASKMCKRYGISREDVKIVDIDALSHALPNFPEKVSVKTESILASQGVEMRFNTKVLNVKPGSMELDTAGNVETVNADIIIWSAGITANCITEKLGKTLSTGKAGRLEENKYLQSVSDKHVYIVGDNMWYIPRHKTSSVLQMVENCEQSGATCANNIAYEITGKGKKKAYIPHLHGALVSLGNTKGIAYAGVDAFKFILPSPLAVLAKRGIFTFYLAQVVPLSMLPKVIINEFLTPRIHM